VDVWESISKLPGALRVLNSEVVAMFMPTTIEIEAV